MVWVGRAQRTRWILADAILRGLLHGLIRSDIVKVTAPLPDISDRVVKPIAVGGKTLDGRSRGKPVLFQILVWKLALLAHFAKAAASSHETCVTG